MSALPKFADKLYLASVPAGAMPNGQWRMVLELQADALRVSDPVPMMLSQFQALPGLAEHCSVLDTVLCELYSNALEHGVLRLSSSLKYEPEGLERYLAAREHELAALHEGWVRLSAVYAQWLDGGELTIRAEDSGPGFDWRSLPTAAPDGPPICGMRLLRGLCKTVAFEGDGNIVVATYAWGLARAANG